MSVSAVNAGSVSELYRAQSTRHTEAADQAKQLRASQEKQDQQTQQAPKATAPSVNTSGQTVGQLINTQA